MNRIDLGELLTDKGASPDTSSIGLSGNPKGEHARAQFGIDAMDEAGDQIVISAPERVISLSPSFVQALFGDSVRKLGSEKAFFERFTFEARPTVVECVRSGVKNILRRMAIEQKRSS